MADPYSILGVSKGADEKAIKSAYRKLAKELHPDKNKDNPKASDRFSDVTRAYDLLSDAQKRGAYDRGEIDENGQPRSPFGAGYGAGFGGGNPFASGGRTQPGAGGFDFNGGIDLGDIFDGLFGGGAGARPGGPNARRGRNRDRRPRARTSPMNIWSPLPMQQSWSRSASHCAMARRWNSNCRTASLPDSKSAFPAKASPAPAAMAMRWSR